MTLLHLVNAFKRLSIAALLCVPAIVVAQGVPDAPAIEAKVWLLEDFHSRQVLVANEADARVEPASITKLMTSYTLFHELRAGTLTLDDEVPISEAAWRVEGSRSFARVGSKPRAEDLLRGLIIQSGNDAAVALAEKVAGSEISFVGLMNEHAAKLGMTGTQYRNASGLSDPEHYTTASDTAKLARALISEFPEYYRWYSEKEFTFEGITQHNRNALLWRDEGVDGLKTGHTTGAGYCLVTSALRGEMRLISVVMGAPSEKRRADDSMALLNYGFRFFETVAVYRAAEVLHRARVYKGAAPEVALALADDLLVTIPRGAYPRLAAQLTVKQQLLAPLTKGQELGTLNLALDQKPLASVPLLAQSDVAEGSFWRRMRDGVSLWFAEDP